MLDRWSDESATKDDLNGKSWTSLARFLGGAYRNEPDCIFSHFPIRVDGEFRRPGIVNFKAILRPAEPRLRQVDKEDFVRELAVGITEKSDSPNPNRRISVEEVELRLAALAGLLALLVDELSGIAAMAVLAPEDELEMIAAAAAACHPTGAVELAGASVFDSKVLCQEMYLAARRSGMLDAGLLLVSYSGEVIGLVLRPRFAGGAAGNGPMVFDQGRPLQVWEIAKQLTRGIAFAKRLAGEVVAYDAKQMQHGDAKGICLVTDGAQIV